MLYLINIKGGNKFKIGITKDFNSRLSNILSASGYTMEEIETYEFYISNDSYIESLLKHVFSPFKRQGEWFFYEGIAQFIFDKLTQLKEFDENLIFEYVRDFNNDYFSKIEAKLKYHKAEKFTTKFRPKDIRFYSPLEDLTYQQQYTILTSEFIDLYSDEVHYGFGKEFFIWCFNQDYSRKSSRAYEMVEEWFKRNDKEFRLLI